MHSSHYVCIMNKCLYCNCDDSRGCGNLPVILEEQCAKKADDSDLCCPEALFLRGVMTHPGGW